MDWADVTNVFTTALSAFGGAWAAFFFESWRERRKEEDAQYGALRFAHFVAMSQYQELITLRDSYLQPLENPDDSGLQLHPVALGFASPNLNVSDLGFVLEGSDPDLLNRLTVGQQRYETVRNLLASRNQLHFELQRRAAALQAQGIDAVEQEALPRMLGNDLVTQLNSITASVLDTHQSATSLLEENLSGISKFISERFPKRRIPRFEIVPQGERH